MESLQAQALERSNFISFMQQKKVALYSDPVKCKTKSKQTKWPGFFFFFKETFN